MSQPQQLINVEGLTNFLRLKQQNTTARFRINTTTDSAIQALKLTYQHEVNSRMTDVVFDADTIQHITKVAEWLTAERPKFGMLLCGICGNGKTTLVRAIRLLIQYLYTRNYQSEHWINLVDAKEIVRLAKTDDRAYKDLCKTEMLAIDDLGIEPSEVLDYGNILNPVIDLLSYRYNEQLFTIITTNLTPPQIREHYGDRIADRFNEMMDRIIFNNPTYRNSRP